MELLNKEQLDMLNDSIYIFQSKTHELFENDKEIDEILFKLPELIKQLQHYYDTTNGLYATDKPKLFKKCKHYKSLFKIK